MHWEEIIMRSVATVLFVLLSLGSFTSVVWAEPSNSCKQCRDQQACAKNYSAKVWKSEYDICMKSCQRR
jgi:hypothetical protein